jgi:hypothetical protein
MEPTDLKSTPPDDAQLEAWLRANATTVPLPDDGFSRRVLAALPAKAGRSVAKRRLFCLGGGLLGTAVALLGAATSGNLPAIEPAFIDALGQLATPAAGWAFGITAISLWFALRRQLRFRPAF